jgi:hypothetical protein
MKKSWTNLQRNKEIFTPKYSKIRLRIRDPVKNLFQIPESKTSDPGCRSRILIRNTARKVGKITISSIRNNNIYTKKFPTSVGHCYLVVPSADSEDVAGNRPAHVPHNVIKGVQHPGTQHNR